MSIIKALQLQHEYIRRDENGAVVSSSMALDGVDLSVEPGQFIAILGHNGSGKSTLAKHINALLSPTGGSLWVNGYDVADENNVFDVRQSAGMVFQNPDNQIIASVVEEDVGFGPENIGVPTDEIWDRVKSALKAVNMWKYHTHSPNRLSGGQKQRVAIAGVMAMEPKCIILDEPTAMLDPVGRKDVLAAVRELNRKKGVTILWITHYMEEVTQADRVIVMDQGKIVMQGTPREIFSQVETLDQYRLDVPQITRLAHELRKAGLNLPEGILTRTELATALKNESKVTGTTDSFEENESKVTGTIDSFSGEAGGDVLQGEPGVTHGGSESSFLLKNISYTYSAGTSYEIKALDDVSLEIPEGQFLGIIGHTGSGKSTLIQHLNGLLKASSGEILFDGENIYGEKYDLRSLRLKVGMVFQYPEHQLFETTVLEDVCFGPKNQGKTPQEAEQLAREALALVKFPEKSYEKSPFDLSGGQKRRAAIAGALAMQPRYLILDEPTAGLDPAGRRQILSLVADLQKRLGSTIILVSHSMEDVAEFVDRMIVMDDGKVRYDGTPREVFSHYAELEQMGLAAPQVTYLMHELAGQGLAADVDATTIEEAKASILKCFS